MEFGVGDSSVGVGDGVTPVESGVGDSSVGVGDGVTPVESGVGDSLGEIFLEQ